MGKVAILICSCDYYSDCWEPIICSFNKYWPDCEYPRYIVTNYEEDYSLPNTQFVKIPNVLDEWGLIEQTKTKETTCKGLYAGGDILNREVRQIFLAETDGRIAATNIIKELRGE